MWINLSSSLVRQSRAMPDIVKQLTSMGWRRASRVCWLYDAGNVITSSNSNGEASEVAMALVVVEWCGLRRRRNIISH